MASLNAIISADVSGFKKSIEDAKRTLNQYTDSVDKQNKINRISKGITQEQVTSYNRVVKALEKVGSGSMTTAQQSKALQTQIKELKIQWANLNETAKNSDFGKALTNSLKKAESHLSQTKAQLASFNDNTNKANTQTKTLSTSFNGLTSLVGKYAVGLGAVTTALKVVKDAFLSSETNIDMWESTVLQSEAAYKVFCTTLNSGNWSNFFNNLNTAIEGAKELYEKLDRLGSIQSNNKAAIAIQEQALAQLRLRKQQGENVDKEIQAVEKRLTYLRGQEVNAGKEAGVEQIKQAIREQNANVNEKDLDKLVNEVINKGQSAFDFYDKKLDELKGKVKTYAKDVVTVTPEGVSIVTKELVEDLSALTDKEKQQLKVYQAFHDAEAGIAKGVEIYANAVQKANQATKEQLKIEKQLGGNKGGKGGKTDNKLFEKQELDISINPTIDDAKLKESLSLSIKDIKETIKYWQKTYEESIDPSVRALAKKMVDQWQKELNNIDNPPELPVKVKLENAAQNIDLSNLKKQTEDVTIPIKYESNIKDEAHNVVSGLKSVYSTFKSLSQSWEDMDAAEKFFAMEDAIFSTINAVQSMSEHFSTLSKLLNVFKTTSSAAAKSTVADNAAITASEQTKQAAETGSAAAGIFSAHSSVPWVGVAIAIAMIGMMIATMAQFHKGGIVGKYANGGIIQGASKLGDMNLARVNDGEMILNSSQQSHLFNLLNSSGGYQNSSTSGNVEFKIKGETLVGVLNNFNKRLNKI